MDSVVLTSASQISPKAGVPLNAIVPVPPVNTEPSEPTPTSEPTNVEIPPESTEQTNVDGNFQAKVDVNYKAHDVALAEAEKANGHEQTNGLKLEPHYKMDIDDGDDHPDKTQSSYSKINKLLLASSAVFFILFLFAIAYITVNTDLLGSRSGAIVSSRTNQLFRGVPEFDEVPDQYVNLTYDGQDSLIVVLSRRGASVHDILVPWTDSDGKKQYRSIILKGDGLGAIRFGFDGEKGSMDMTSQLPGNYSFLNFHEQDWSMRYDMNRRSRVRFVKDAVEVVYELSPSIRNELIMTTIVSPKLYEQLIIDPTNNIYFNLRGQGDLTTHYLNISSSAAFDLKTHTEVQNNPTNQGNFANQLADINKYFYKLNRPGIGKNFIATLMESETKMKVNIFADHVGISIDSSGVVSSSSNTTIADINGIRISPRQTPTYETLSVYGPTLVVYPSQAIHTTWWQFEY